MFEHITDSEERGQVGIGTLIVFIALVLVAAIAAGVLINTAGFLQTQAEQTGEQSSDQVTDRLEPLQKTGAVDVNDEVSNVTLVLQKAPGASNINISAATVSYTGPGGTERFDLDTFDKGFLYNTSLQDEDGSLEGGYLILNDQSDQLVLSTNLTDYGQTEPLAPGQTAEIRITGQSGGTSVIQITVPDSLSGESSVSL
jgi:flagellin-like protein